MSDSFAIFDFQLFDGAKNLNSLKRRHEYPLAFRLMQSGIDIDSVLSIPRKVICTILQSNQLVLKSCEAMIFMAEAYSRSSGIKWTFAGQWLSWDLAVSMVQHF